MTAPNPDHIPWFAPWTWKRRWMPWQRWTLIVGVALNGYALSAAPVAWTVNRLCGARVADDFVRTVYLPLVWIDAHSPAARRFFQMEQDWMTALLGDP